MRLTPLAILLLGVVFLADAQAPRTAKEVYDRGTELYRHGRYKEAAGFYRMAYEIEPNTSTLLAAARAYYRDRGVICVQLDDLTRIEAAAAEIGLALGGLRGEAKIAEDKSGIPLMPKLNPFDFGE